MCVISRSVQTYNSSNLFTYTLNSAQLSDSDAVLFTLRIQNDISKTYGERRQIRDDLLHIESMQKQAQYTIIKKRRILDRLDMMSSECSTAESQVGSQVCVTVL